MEHSKLMHMHFAKGRIETGLAPAPKRFKRPFYKRWQEAISVLVGRSYGVRCYDDIEPPEGEEAYVDGTVSAHPVVPVREVETEK